VKEETMPVDEDQVTINARGNEIRRGFRFAYERYHWDLGKGFLGMSDWEQFDTDQDAHYFGFWVNKRTLQTFTFCEGDVTLVNCPDVAHFNAEVEDAIRLYREGQIATVIDMSGKMTRYVQDRQKFLIPKSWGPRSPEEARDVR
jgi:hypothetical protein